MIEKQWLIEICKTRRFCLRAVYHHVKLLSKQTLKQPRTSDKSKILNIDLNHDKKNVTVYFFFLIV